MNKELELRILERDNFTCVSCGKSIRNEGTVLKLVQEIDNEEFVCGSGGAFFENLHTYCSSCPSVEENKSRKSAIQTNTDLANESAYLKKRVNQINTFLKLQAANLIKVEDFYIEHINYYFVGYSEKVKKEITKLVIKKLKNGISKERVEIAVVTTQKKFKESKGFDIKEFVKYFNSLFKARR